MHGEACESNILQALGLDKFCHTLLHVAPGQFFCICADPLHGGVHHLVVAHRGQTLQLLLLGLFLFSLPGFPFCFALGFSCLMLGTAFFLVRIGGYIGLGGRLLLFTGIVPIRALCLGSIVSVHFCQFLGPIVCIKCG